MTKTKSNLRINLSAIIYQEDGVWIAHCLELDIVSEGKTVDAAVSGLVSLCDLQIKTAMEAGDLGSIFRPAPPEIWQMFSTAETKSVTERAQTHRKGRFKGPVDRFEARQLAFA
jgi:predicted RNase H-like HicB family nuclease